MKRRQFVTGLAAGLSAALLPGCSKQSTAGSGAAGGVPTGKTYRWKMVTTWPPNFPGIGTGASQLAKNIGEMSAGRIEIRVYGAGELVPAFEVFDAVSRGAAEMGHGAAYYWKGKTQASQFFAAVPFGLTAQEMNAWLYHGGGHTLWREVYEPFGLLPFPAGNTGVQMGGWFNKEIRSIADLQGLKMRIPGLGGEVLRRAGGTPVSLPGGEILTSLQTGNIDATEWIGPYNDLAFGLHQAAKYYYYPGWHEPCATLECMVNRAAYDALPADLRAIVRSACSMANETMLAEYTARNHVALRSLIDEHEVELREFPSEVLNRLETLAREVMTEIAEADPLFAKVHDSYRKFQTASKPWQDISERAYLNARSG